jgi:hypothetical protein
MKTYRMKRFFPAALLIFNGCFSCGTASQVLKPDPELTVYRPAAPALEDRHPSSSLERVAPGAWVRYQVTKDGGDTTIILGAVRIEEKSLWIESVEEGDPRKASLRRVSFDGQVMAARYQEIPASAPASEVVNQQVLSAADSYRDPPASEKVSEEARQVGAASPTVKIIRKVFRDDSVGREYEEEEWWLDAIPPLLEGLEKAGLAYRKSTGVTIKALEWGTGYTPSIK